MIWWNFSVLTGSTVYPLLGMGKYQKKNAFCCPTYLPSKPPIKALRDELSLNCNLPKLLPHLIDCDGKI